MNNDRLKERKGFRAVFSAYFFNALKSLEAMLRYW